MSNGPQDDVGGSDDHGQTPPPFAPEGPAVGATGPPSYPGPAPGPGAGGPPAYPGPAPAPGPSDAPPPAYPPPAGPPGYPPPSGPPGYPPPAGPPGYPPPSASPAYGPGPAPGPYDPSGYGPSGYSPPGYGPPGYQSPFAPPAPNYAQAGPPPLAPYGSRLGGWIIDWLIFVVVGIVLNRIFNNASFGRIHFHITNTNTHVTTYYHFSIVGPLLQAVLVILYGGLLCGSQRGQTVGMMAVRVRAFDANTGEPIGYGRGIWRGFFEYLLAILFFIPWVIDMLFPIWDSRNQTLHDKVSNTVVVKLPPKTLGP